MCANTVKLPSTNAPVKASQEKEERPLGAALVCGEYPGPSDQQFMAVAVRFSISTPRISVSKRGSTARTIPGKQVSISFM